MVFYLVDVRIDIQESINIWNKITGRTNNFRCMRRYLKQDLFDLIGKSTNIDNNLRLGIKEIEKISNLLAKINELIIKLSRDNLKREIQENHLQEEVFYLLGQDKIFRELKYDFLVSSVQCQDIIENLISNDFIQSLLVKMVEKEKPNIQDIGKYFQEFAKDRERITFYTNSLQEIIFNQISLTQENHFVIHFNNVNKNYWELNNRLQNTNKRYQKLLKDYLASR